METKSEEVPEDCTSECEVIGETVSRGTWEQEVRERRVTPKGGNEVTLTERSMAELSIADDGEREVGPPSRGTGGPGCRKK